MKKFCWIFIIIFFYQPCFSKPLPINLLKLPPGFNIDVYTDSVPGAREMSLGPNNTIFVGTREGKVYAVLQNSKPKETSVLTLASGLNMPNGVAFHNNDLYVMEIDRLLIFKNIMVNLHSPKPIVINHVLPDKTHHGWRYIRFGPDNKLYVGVGAPCNNCLRKDPRFASIVRMDLNGSNQEVYARGIRNTVGFDWHPITHQLWFTDNGRDLMGDDVPPDELNHIEKANQHFGYPYCHGKNISDPEFGKIYPCSRFVSPDLELAAHAASLGMIFYTGSMFPKSYYHQIFIAQHGSWNRSTKIGYDVIRVNLNDKKSPFYEVFISGWLQGEKPWGRPVDLLQMNDGSLLISDDHAGAIYRVTYRGSDS